MEEERGANFDGAGFKVVDHGRVSCEGYSVDVDLTIWLGRRRRRRRWRDSCASRFRRLTSEKGGSLS